jgi:hypothetical protein
VLETGKDQFGKVLAEQPRLCIVWVHRTVRWCTGQCPVRQAGSGELAALRFHRRRTAINHRTVRWCTGLSGEPTVGRANGRPRNPRATRGRANGQKGGTGLSGVHRIVSGAPTALNLQRSASPKKERNPHRIVSGGAPDCPVHKATEGKNCLTGMLSTAPSCLRAIKRTPRRMEENTKHSLSISKHQDSNSAHSIPCDSN